MVEMCSEGHSPPHLVILSLSHPLTLTPTPQKPHCYRAPCSSRSRASGRCGACLHSRAGFRRRCAPASRRGRSGAGGLSSSVPRPVRWYWSLTRMRKLAVVGAVQLGQAGPCRRSACGRCSSLRLGHQRHFAVVVDEAERGQLIVRHQLRRRHRVEVAQVDAVGRERAVEGGHHRLVFRADGADDRPLRRSGMVKGAL